jgi:AcrR family transcriptional regulator
MTNPSSELALLLGEKAIVGLSQRLVGWLSSLRAGEKIDMAYEETKEELLFAVIDEVRKLNDRIDANVRDTEAIRALLAINVEALRSPLTERIRMLARAFAGFLKPDLRKEQRARAFRTALQLEPYDVLYLRSLSGEAAATEQLKMMEQDTASWDGLIATGCLALGDVYEGGELPTYEVTTLGRHVLWLLKEHLVLQPKEAPSGAST